jgi:hypothetical protein
LDPFDRCWTWPPLFEDEMIALRLAGAADPASSR